MKIELTMTELMLIVDMIKNGTEQDNDGQNHQREMKCESCGGEGYHKLSCSHNPDRQPEIPMEQTKEYINRYGDLHFERILLYTLWR